MPYLNSESDWLLQFDKPLPGEMAQLRAILAAATVASNKTENRLRGELGHAVAVEGSLDHVLARIADRLEADYVESRVERSREPWSFGYVVKDLFPANSVIEVLTRFFDHTQRR